MFTTLTSYLPMAKTTDNYQNLMFMIDEENTVNLNINVQKQATAKKNTIKITTETTKSEAELPETVKLITKPGKTVAEKSPKRRSLMSTIRRRMISTYRTKAVLLG